LKENVSLRLPSEVKKILDEIAEKEYRPLANVMEKLILERLRDLGYLDEKFQLKDRKIRK
jgi:predicted transcriptional regulator